MPNWTENNVIVKFKSNEQKTRWIQSVKSDKSEFDFKKIIPYEFDNPAYIDDGVGYQPVDDEHKNFNWYDFCNDKWGVKWPASDVEVEDKGLTIEYSFFTPWSGPVGIYERLLADFPDVDIDWTVLYEGEDKWMDIED